MKSDKYVELNSINLETKVFYRLPKGNFLDFFFCSAICRLWEKITFGLTDHVGVASDEVT